VQLAALAIVGHAGTCIGREMNLQLERRVRWSLTSTSTMGRPTSVVNWGANRVITHSSRTILLHNHDQSLYFFRFSCPCSAAALARANAFAASRAALRRSSARLEEAEAPYTDETVDDERSRVDADLDD